MLERHTLAWDHLWQRFDLPLEGHADAERILDCTCSTSCRPCRPTPSTSTSASRPADCTARPTAGTSSGTSCSSSRSSTCGFRSSRGRCSAYRSRRLNAGSVRPPSAKRATAPCSRGRAAATAARRPRPSTSTRSPGGGSPITPAVQRHIEPRGRLQRLAATTRSPAIVEFLRYPGAELIIEVARFWRASPPTTAASIGTRSRG